MLLSLKDLTHYSIHVKDGEAGKLEQFYFDDATWTVRYGIVNTGKWFNRSKVLLSPLSFLNIDCSHHRIATHLTREQLENSPDFDSEKPISRQMEQQFLDYYRWPSYWTGAGIWGSAATLGGEFEIPPSDQESQVSILQKQIQLGIAPQNEDYKNNHLRSTKEVLGYQVEASNAEFGRIDDLIIDEPSWIIRYLVIHLRKWLPSKAVLISKEWVQCISWQQRKFQVSVSQEKIRTSPEFVPHTSLNRQYEELLHQHYGRQKYWEQKHPPQSAA